MAIDNQVEELLAAAAKAAAEADTPSVKRAVTSILRAESAKATGGKDTRKLDAVLESLKTGGNSRQALLDSIATVILDDDYKLVGPSLLIFLHNTISGPILAQSQHVAEAVMQTMQDEDRAQVEAESRAIVKRFSQASNDADGLSMVGVFAGIIEILGMTLNKLPPDKSRVAFALAFGKLAILMAKKMDEDKAKK